jgi:GLPGLI family protein
MNKSNSQYKNIVVEYTEINSLGAPNVNLQSYNAALYVTSGMALYVSKIDSLEAGGKKTIQKTYKDSKGKFYGVRSFSSHDGLYQITDRNTNILYSNARFSNRFLYKETPTKIQWEITNTIKKMEGLTVQKATTKFRGRNYVAWFTPEIPVSLGPWKLNGLPGLILEAYDTNKEMLFLFKKIEYPYKNKIKFPSIKRNWMTYKDFLKEKEKHVDRNLKYSRAIGEQFDAKASDAEIEKLRKKNFIEITD